MFSASLHEKKLIHQVMSVRFRRRINISTKILIQKPLLFFMRRGSLKSLSFQERDLG